MRISEIDARHRPDYFPYYKVQWRDGLTGWRDVQKRHATRADAVVAADSVARRRRAPVRLMMIHRDRRVAEAPLSS